MGGRGGVLKSVFNLVMWRVMSLLTQPREYNNDGAELSTNAAQTPPNVCGCNFMKVRAVFLSRTGV